MVNCGFVDSAAVGLYPGLDALTLETFEPGIVRVGIGPIRPFAVLDGRLNPLIEGTPTNLPHHLQRVLKKAMPADNLVETQAVWRECLLFAVLARMILEDGHGGAVLIVPAPTGTYVDSLNPFAYRLAAVDATIPETIRRELRVTQAQGDAIQRVSESELPGDVKNAIIDAMGNRPWYVEQDVRAVASLAKVDGAIVITKSFEVLGFGAKITVAGSDSPPVCLFRPEPGKQEVVLSALEAVGGTRHQSAARFVAVHEDTVALVISQDRHLSVLHWDDSIGAVAVVRNAEWWL